MPRRGFVPKREILPDPLYNSKLVTKLIPDTEEAEEFAMSVYRKCVLNGFETKPRQITNEQLKLFGYQTEE